MNDQRKKDILPLILIMLLSYGIAAGVRLLEIPQWDNPAFKIGNEYIMATHDAYAWLAGAVKTGFFQNHPMAYLASGLAKITGAPLGVVAFWAPVFIASLVALVVVLWAFTLEALPAGIIAGAMGALAPGFFFRTRLGFFDSDIVTLFFPLAITWGLAYWLKPYLRPTWLQKKQATPTGDVPVSLLIPFLTGALAAFAAPWHNDLSRFSLVAAVIALGLILILAESEKRGRLLSGLAIFGLTAFFGLWGIGLGVAVLALFSFRPAWLEHRFALPLAAVILGLSLSYGVFELSKDLYVKFLVYAKPVAETINASQDVPTYPGITQSVREAQNIDWTATLGRLAPNPWIGALGMAGFLLVVWSRPLAILILPLASLGLLSGILGSRLNMFSGPAVALGLSIPIYWLVSKFLKDLQWKQRLVHPILALISLLILFPWAQYVRAIPVQPILSREHCLALKRLHEVAPKDSLIWTWWDYGYAAQYFAQRPSFADGGSRSGPFLFTSGLAMTSGSPLQSSQLMNYAGVNDGRPWNVWDSRTSEEVKSFLQSLASQTFSFHPKTKQYFVATWDNFALISWISYYGTWDLKNKSGTHAFATMLNSSAQIHREQGLLIIPGRKPISLVSLDTLGPQGREVISFPQNPQGLHLLIHTSKRQAAIMDDLAYGSTMVQLLLQPSDSPLVSKYFKLVHEGFPDVRIFEVL